MSDTENVVTTAEPEVKQEAAPAPEPEVKTDQSKPEATVEPKQPEAPDDKEEKPNRLQSRINELTREKYEAIGRVKALEQMMGKAPVEAQPTPKPVRNQFQDEGSYVEALTDWKVTQRLPEIAQRTQQETAKSAHDRRVEAARAEFPDFDEKISQAAAVPIPSDVYQAVVSSELGPNISYYLATHLEEAEKLNSMPIAAAVMRIGRIEAQLEAEKKTVKPKPKVSGAPAPINPVNPSGATPETDLDKLPASEAIKIRQKQYFDKRFPKRK